MGDLTAHFSRWEFDCPHCKALDGPTPELLAMLERLRNIVRKPLVIVSGYRCETYNRRVGGISRSQHRRGNAVDIRRWYCTPSQAFAAGAVGVGVRDGAVIHLDMTPGRAPFTFAE